MKTILSKKILLTSACLCLVPSCVTTYEPIPLQKFHKEKITEKSYLGVTLNFENSPDEIFWYFILELKNKETQKIITLKSTLHEFAKNMTNGPLPLVFSIPKGTWDVENMYLYFPKKENDLYTLADEKAGIPTLYPIPTLQFIQNTLIYLGEITIQYSNFIKGKTEPPARIHIKYDIQRPIDTRIWNEYLEKFKQSNLYAMEFAEPPTKFIQVKARQMDEQTTETNLNIFSSGFGNNYSLVIFSADMPGTAFFQEKNEKIIAVESMQMAKKFIYAVNVSAETKIKLLGICEKNPNKPKCTRETLQTPFSYNRETFKIGEIRYLGHLTQQKTWQNMLTTEIESEVNQTLPFATWRTFYLAEEIRRTQPQGFIFGNIYHLPQEQWDNISASKLQALTPEILSCYKELQEIDPLVTTKFSLLVGKNEKKSLTIVPWESKGLTGSATRILKGCLDPVLNKIKDIPEEAGIYDGFSIIFQ